MTKYKEDGKCWADTPVGDFVFVDVDDDDDDDDDDVVVVVVVVVVVGLIIVSHSHNCRTSSQIVIFPSSSSISP